MAESDRSHSSSFRDDLQFIWVRKWLIIAVVVVFTAGAFLYANRQTRMYVATAIMMYEQQTNISNVLGSTSTDATGLSLELQSAVNTVNTATVSKKANTMLGVSGADSTGVYVSASVVKPDTNAGSSVSNQVAVQAVSSKPAIAAAVANAYAAAIIEARVEQQQQQLVKAQDAIRSQMTQFGSPDSKLSTDYLLLAQRLRELQVAEATITGDFTIVEFASIPSAPYTPKPLRSAVFGFGVGLVFGVGLAYGIGMFDTRIRSHREAGEILGLSVAARIPRIPRDTLGDGPLISLTAPRGHVAESLRVLRSSLDWMAVDGDLKSILFTSSEKGEGKTLSVCNLAVTLALAGKSVVLVDADLRDPRVHASFGMPNATGLSTVIHGSLELSEALRSFELRRPSSSIIHTSTAGTEAASDLESQNGSLKILTSGPLPPNPGEVIASRRTAAVLQRLAESEADYVLIDAPPILAIGDAGALAPSVDGLLFVCNLGVVRRPALEDARDALNALPCRKLGVVVVGERMESTRYRGYGYA